MNNLAKSSLNYLTVSELDRLPPYREDPSLFDNIIKSRSSRFLFLKKDEILLSDGDAVDPVLLAYSNARFSEDPKPENCFLLGERKGLTYFVLDLDLYRGLFATPPGTDYLHLRKSRLNAKKWTGAMLAYGFSLINWHRNNRYCGRCGAATEVADWGQVRNCSNSNCATPHYPRTDPAIIVAVTRDDKCLMARKNGMAGRALFSYCRLCRSWRISGRYSGPGSFRRNWDSGQNSTLPLVSTLAFSLHSYAWILCRS